MRFTQMKMLLLLMIIFVMVGICSCKNISPDIDIKTPYVNENDIVFEAKETEGNLEVHFIDVGQADCILVKNDEVSMLIDAGNNDDGELIEKYLKNEDITKLDYVIGTHPHEDHIGALDVVINNFDVNTIIMPNKVSTTKTFEDVITAIENKNLSINEAKVGDKYSLGDAEFVILAPDRDYEEINDVSVVIRLVHGENSFMFTGDAEEVSEGDILKSGLVLKSDVLKFGHHGSSTSTSEKFLEAVSPKYGVIMCGVDNSYGHPHRETLSKIRKYDIEVYRTDTQGTIVATSDGKNISWQADRLVSTSIDNPKENTVSMDVNYVLNTNSKKFHYPSCSGVNNISDKNRKEFFGKREDLIADGYSACGTCKP